MNLHIHYSTGFNMIKKMVLLVCFFVVGTLAAGGDTVKIDATFKAFKDGDIIRANQHFHSPVDSIVKVVNGKLGNVNISSTANIAVSKLDSTGTIKSRKIRIDSTATVDSLKARVIKVDSIYSEQLQSYSPTKIGWSSTTVSLTNYSRIGNLVTVGFDIEGTSNDAQAIVYLPYYSAANAAYSHYFVFEFYNNGAYGFGFGYINANDNKAILYTNSTYGAWSSTGAKKAYGTFTYLKQ